jgi:hypothetical protein
VRNKLFESMRALKSIVRGFFAIQAAFFLLIPLAAIFGGLRSHLGRYLAHSTAEHAHRAAAIGFGIVAGLLVVGLVFCHCLVGRLASHRPRAEVGQQRQASSMWGEGILAMLLTPPHEGAA